MKKPTGYYLLICLLILFILACDISFNSSEDVQSNQKDLELKLTEVALQITQTALVSPDSEEKLNPESAPLDSEQDAKNGSNDQNPCNSSKFVGETISDGTVFQIGETFTKSWTLKNIGTCTWNTNYQLVFSGGDKMGGPSTVNLPQQVSPNEMINISVILKAPDEVGNFKGYWKVQDDRGNNFVNNLWVDIETKAELNPDLIQSLLALKPDLVITALEIAPSTPVMGKNAHIRVKAQNEGTLDSSGFNVSWYGLESFGTPSCIWSVSEGLAAGGSIWLECDYTYQSWLKRPDTTIAYIDSSNTVIESDESNNSRSIYPFIVNP